MGNTLGIYRSEVSQCPAGADGVCLVSDVCVSLCQVWRQCGCVFRCSSAAHRLPESLQDASGSSQSSPLLVCVRLCL